MTTILGIRLAKRNETATKFQEILSKYGCNIKTRIGLHDVSDGVCASDGVILLEVIGAQEIISGMVKEIELIENSKIEVMTI